MGTTKEQSPSTRAKVRGALPGEGWREYVSPGAQKAYDGPLSTQREEAHKLARKGRLVAAHKREKAAYKIRVRGYDRKHGKDLNVKLAAEAVEKAYTSRSVAVGPVKYATKKLQLRKPTKGEERAEQLRAVLGGVGTIKLAAGAGAGALVTDAVKDAKDRSKKATVTVKNKIKPEETKVTKSVDDLATRVTMGSIVLDAPDRIVSKSDSLSLVEISKVFGLGAVKAMAGNAYRTGGVRGVLDTARQQYKAPIMPGGGSAADAVSSFMKPAATAGAAAGGTAAAGWGAKKLMQRYAPAVAEPLKKKAKKYALYGAAGAAGTVAAGTAAGNALSPRR